MVRRTEAFRKRYAQLIEKISDVEFTGLYLAVMDERAFRLLKMMTTNPIVREMILREAREELENSVQAVKDGNN